MKNPLEYHKLWGVTLIRKMPFKFNCFRETLKSLRDGGDAFQGARAAAALATIALVLALTFPDTAAVPDFRAGGSVGKVGTGA